MTTSRPIHSSPPWRLLPRVLLEHETGESAQGEVYLKRLLEAMRGAGPYRLFESVRVSVAIPAIARITGVPDRLEIAEATAETVLSGQSVTPIYAMHAKAGLTSLALQRDDRTAAEEHYASLLGHPQSQWWTNNHSKITIH